MDSMQKPANMRWLNNEESRCVYRAIQTSSLTHSSLSYVKKKDYPGWWKLISDLCYSDVTSVNYNYKVSVIP